MRALGFTALALAAGLVAGCSSLSMPTAARLKTLDYLNDDIGSLVLAFDVPETLEPVPEASRFSFVVSIPGQGERKVDAVLAPGDASDVAGTLPPPGNERTYYLFGFSDADKARLREAQAWARSYRRDGRDAKHAGHRNHTPVLPLRRDRRGGDKGLGADRIARQHGAGAAGQWTESGGAVGEHRWRGFASVCGAFGVNCDLSVGAPLPFTGRGDQPKAGGGGCTQR